MTHTPLPWKIDKVTQYIGAPEIIADRRRIAKVLYHGGSEDREVDDNAAYIVQACNAYPALLEACREMARILKAPPEHIYGYVGMGRVHQLVHAALAQVDSDD